MCFIATVIRILFCILHRDLVYFKDTRYRTRDLEI